MGPSIDLFCRVIDNLGDIGVSWRLARQLTQEHSASVRLWVDHLASLARLEPAIDPDLDQQSCQAIQILRWSEQNLAMMPFLDKAPDIVIAAFSCDLPTPYLERLKQHPQATWYQLDYLSAQHWVRDFHLQRSVRADGLRPIFFFPGFTPDVGGLIREQALTAHLNNSVDETKKINADWLQRLGIASSALQKQRLVSVFTYAHAPIEALVEHIEAQQQPTLMLIPEGVNSRLHELDPTAYQYVTWQTIPFLSQPDYDRLLASMDLNLVRGEDSFVRAIWAGRPFIWHIYPQDAGEHHRKLQAWLEVAELPDEVGQIMHEWSQGHLSTLTAQVFSTECWDAWQRQALLHRQKLLRQTDLVTRLLTHWQEDQAKN